MAGESASARAAERVRVFGAVMSAVEAELNWAHLGKGYCEGDGSTFFDAPMRERILDVGLLFAGDVAGALTPGGPGRSLYLGAAVAELAPILAERLVLSREIVWLNLESEETEELTRALRAVGERLEVELPLPSTRTLDSVAAASCDHVWMVSVLTDPDAFPALHDELYERTGGPLATGRGAIAYERIRAAALADALLARAAIPCALTTTDEELTLIRPLVEQRGLSLQVPEAGRLSAVVGDMVRVCRLQR